MNPQMKMVNTSCKFKAGRHPTHIQTSLYQFFISLEIQLIRNEKLQENTGSKKIGNIYMITLAISEK